MKYLMRTYALLMVILSIPFILLTLLLRGLYVFCAYIIIVVYAVVWILYKSLCKSLWLRTTDLLFALLFPESKEARFEEFKMEQKNISEDELKEILEELWKDKKKK